MLRCLRIMLFLMISALVAYPYASRAETAPALERVVLQLKWQHQFQFAGFYMAAEKGFYREAGLDVEIRPAKPGSDPTASVLSGDADFGIGTSELLLMRSRGAPVVVLAPILQHSPFVLIALPGRGFNTVQALAGQTIMAEEQAAELWAYMANEGISPSAVKRVPHAFDIQPLLRGDVAAMTAYVSDEPYELRQMGIHPIIMTPQAGGIDFYGDTLFTVERQIKDHPQRTKAFIDASLRGWVYAMDHPDEAISVIERSYPSTKSKDHLEYEAKQIEKLILPHIVEIGHNNTGRWLHIAQTYQGLGLLSRSFSFDGFLYQQEKQPLPLWVKWLSIISLFVIVILSFFLRRTQSLARKLQERERRLQLLTDNMIDVIWTANSSLCFTYCSPSIELLTGSPAHTLLGKSLLSNLKDQSRLYAEQALARAMANARAEKKASTQDVWLELELLTARGSTVWVEAAARLFFDANYHLTDVQGVTRDISERHALKVRLEQLANTDFLTNLLNRRAFLDLFEAELAQSRDMGHPLSLVLVDLDHFKRINDTWGHPIGDAVLCHIAKMLTGFMGSGDIIARLGGEEFALLLPNTSVQNACIRTEKIRALIEATPLLIDEERYIPITASFGIAESQARDCYTDLYQRADEALYLAKGQGRNCWRQALSSSRNDMAERNKMFLPYT